MRRALAVTLAIAAIGTTVASGRTSFTVSSTLAGRRVLPHRIHWLGRPTLPPAKIREVDFVVDGRRAWVERRAPYSYGYDANYLVTSWLHPGQHTFTLVAIATDGSRATVSSRARSVAPRPPPRALAGSWHRHVSTAEANGSGPAGTWTLTVDAIGWHILDPSRARGALIDVAYLSPGTVEARGGIATRDHDPRENNLWCDEPFQPVRYNWRAEGGELTLTLAGPRRCGAQSRVWAAVWTRG
jgi:hypothetical protein